MRCQNVRARGGPPDTHARRAPSIAISDNQPPPSQRVLRFGSLGPKDKLASHTRIVASAHRKLEKHHDPHTLIKKHHPEYSRPAAHPRRIEEKPRPSPELKPPRELRREQERTLRWNYPSRKKTNHHSISID